MILCCACVSSRAICMARDDRQAQEYPGSMGVRLYSLCIDPRTLCSEVDKQ